MQNSSYKEAKQFSYYSRGSLFETKTFLRKACNRSLINNEEFEAFSNKIKIIGMKLNNYINSICKGPNDSIIKEEEPIYYNSFSRFIDL